MRLSNWLHKTHTGRIVYERPKHEFSQRDLKRLFGRVAPTLDYPALRALITWLDDQMLALILEPIGLSGAADQVRQLLEEFVGQLIKHGAMIVGLKVTYLDPVRNQDTDWTIV